MPIDGLKVTQIRSREGSRLRARGGGWTEGEVIMLDTSASHALTSAAVDPNSLGAKGTASGIRATAIPAPAGAMGGVIGVATSDATDNLLGTGALGSCTVDALVEVGPMATVGAALQIASVAGYSVFTADGTGLAYATLEEEATANDITFGDSTLIVKRRVRIGAGSGGSGGGGGGEAGAFIADGIDADELMDPLGLGQRWAATNNNKDGDTGVFAAVTWGPSSATAGGELHIIASSAVTPAGKRNVIGRTAANSPNLAVQTDGTVQLQSNTVGVLTSSAGAFTFDGREYAIRATFTSTGIALYIDGDLVASESGSYTWVTTQFSGGIGAGWTTGDRWPGTLRDAQYVDLADSDKSSYWRLDEQDGPYYNAYLKLDDPLYSATNTAATTANRGTGITSTLVLSTDNAARGLVESDFEVARPTWAAYGSSDNTNSLGAIASVSWAPVAGVDFEVAFTASMAAYHTGGVVVFGRASANYCDISLTSTGQLRFRNFGATLGISASGAFPADGREHVCRIAATATTCSGWIDGVLVFEETVSTQSWSTTPADHFIGAYTAASNGRIPGTLRNVKVIDNTTAANSATFYMNERTGSYINTYSGTTVGNATRNGTVESRLVSTTDGLAPLADPTADIPKRQVVLGSTISTEAGTSIASDVDMEYVRCTSGSAVTFTITEDIHEVGAQFAVVQAGAGTVTFAPGTAVTLNSPGGMLDTAAQYNVVTITCVASNTFDLEGALA